MKRNSSDSRCYDSLSRLKGDPDSVGIVNIQQQAREEHVAIILKAHFLSECKDEEPLKVEKHAVLIGTSAREGAPFPCWEPGDVSDGQMLVGLRPANPAVS